MKFLFLVLFLGVAQAAFLRSDRVYHDRSNYGNKHLDRDFYLNRDYKLPVDKDLVRIQLDVLELLRNVNHLSTDKRVLDVSQNYRLEDNLECFTDKKNVMDLVRLYRSEGFLNRDKVFNVLDDAHRYEASTAARVLLNAKTLEDFFNAACWLRNRMNCGSFVYAFSVAVKNRDDCVGVHLPPMYETAPYKFFKNRVIEKAHQLKMQGDVFDEKYAKTLGVERVDNNVYVIDADYTGVNIRNNGEQRMNYFTEDIGLNNNYYMAHITTPFWLNYQNFQVNRHDNHRRGEFFAFAHQQLLARYYMERLCNGLGEIENFKFDRPVREGYNPSLRHHNGLEYSVRPNNYLINNADNVWELKTFNDFERRIRNAIDRGYFWTEEGTTVSLRKPEDLDTLGNLLACNAISENHRFYHGLRLAFRMLGNRRVIDDSTGRTPSVLENYSTMLRDPVTYQFFKRLMFNVYKFNTKLRPYGYDELNFKGVRINDVKVDKLVTYFETYEVDITNAVNRNVDEMRNNNEEMVIKARHVRLNHVPFNVEVDVTSDVSGDCVVKTFLGPKFDGVNRKINFDENRENFFLLDRHVTTLNKGANNIVRNSRQFNLVTDDMIPTHKLTTRIEKCLKGEEECYTRDIKNTVLIPDRLALPRGTHGGMPFQLFVTVTPFVADRSTERSDRYETYGYNFRYPLDRKIVRAKEFLSCDNFFLRDVAIYNREGVYDKHTGEFQEVNGDRVPNEARNESPETYKHRREHYLYNDNRRGFYNRNFDESRDHEQSYERYAREPRDFYNQHERYFRNFDDSNEQEFYGKRHAYEPKDFYNRYGRNVNYFYGKNSDDSTEQDKYFRGNANRYEPKDFYNRYGRYVNYFYGKNSDDSTEQGKYFYGNTNRYEPKDFYNRYGRYVNYFYGKNSDDSTEQEKYFHGNTNKYEPKYFNNRYGGFMNYFHGKNFDDSKEQDFYGNRYTNERRDYYNRYGYKQGQRYGSDESRENVYDVKTSGDESRNFYNRFGDNQEYRNEYFNRNFYNREGKEENYNNIFGRKYSNNKYDRANEDAYEHNQYNRDDSREDYGLEGKVHKGNHYGSHDKSEHHKRH